MVNRGQGRARRSSTRFTLLVQDPEFVKRFELVVAGPISDSERKCSREASCEIVRVLGLLPRPRALGLQQAADGLLLIPGGAGATTAKVYEYLGGTQANLRSD